MTGVERNYIAFCDWASFATVQAAVLLDGLSDYDLAELRGLVSAECSTRHGVPLILKFVRDLLDNEAVCREAIAKRDPHANDDQRLPRDLADEIPTRFNPLPGVPF